MTAEMDHDAILRVVNREVTDLRYDIDLLADRACSALVEIQRTLPEHVRFTAEATHIMLAHAWAGPLLNTFIDLSRAQKTLATLAKELEERRRALRRRFAAPS